MGFSKSLLGSQRTLMASNGPQWVKIGLHKWTWFFFCVHVSVNCNHFLVQTAFSSIVLASNQRQLDSRCVFTVFFTVFCRSSTEDDCLLAIGLSKPPFKLGIEYETFFFGVERWLLAEVFFSFFSFFFYSSFVGWMIAATELRGCLFRVTRHFGGNQFDVIRRKLISTHDTLWLVAGGLMVASGWSEEEKKNDPPAKNGSRSEESLH